MFKLIRETPTIGELTLLEVFELTAGVLPTFTMLGAFYPVEPSLFVASIEAVLT
jgi:hypothetical protein